MRAWKRMRDVMGVHLGLPPGELIRGWMKQPDPDEWLAAQHKAHNAQIVEAARCAALCARVCTCKPKAEVYH